MNKKEQNKIPAFQFALVDNMPTTSLQDTQSGVSYRIAFGIEYFPDDRINIDIYIEDYEGNIFEPPYMSNDLKEFVDKFNKEMKSQKERWKYFDKNATFEDILRGTYSLHRQYPTNMPLDYPPIHAKIEKAERDKNIEERKIKTLKTIRDDPSILFTQYDKIGNSASFPVCTKKNPWRQNLVVWKKWAALIYIV